MSVRPVNLTIGIIGAGMIGSGLARHFVQAKHTVRIANSRGPETLKDVASSTGATATTVEEAVDKAHVVVVTVPLNKVPQLNKNLFMSLPPSTIIIDTNNYYPARDGAIAELDGTADKPGVAESRWVETQLGCKVVKVFNNIDQHSLREAGSNVKGEGRVALPVSGEDAVHKQTVIALLDQFGFDGVDAGTIDASWRQEPGTPCYGTNYGVEGLRKALGKADRARSAEVRDVEWKTVGAKIAAGEPWEKLYLAFREVVDEQYGK